MTSHQHEYREHRDGTPHRPGDALMRVPGMVEEVLDRLTALPSSLRQNYVDELWAEIAAVVDESAFSAALAAGAPLDVTAVTTTAETIITVVACVPAGATGTVQLDNLVLPVPAGVTIITGVRKVLTPSAVRRLTLAGAGGAAALWLTGTQAPTYGVIS